MKSFLIPTGDFIKTEKTEVATATAAGTAVGIVVKNNQGFEVDDYIIVKREGTEEAHICKITSVSGNNTIIVETLKHNLVAGDPVVKVLFNQRRIWGCATSGGTFSELTDSPTDIEVDRPDGTLFEYTGSTYLYFKATYYNSTTLETTSLDDADEISTLETAHYCSVFDIRQESGFQDNDYVDSGRIDGLRIQAESEVKASVGSIYALPLSASCEVIKMITKLLASGWLMLQEYGEEASGTSKDGSSKVIEARSMLKAIRERRLVLRDSSDTELTKISIPEGQIKGWPDDTTKDADDDDAGGDVHFRISKEF